MRSDVIVIMSLAVELILAGDHMYVPPVTNYSPGNVVVMTGVVIVVMPPPLKAAKGRILWHVARGDHATWCSQVQAMRQVVGHMMDAAVNTA